MKLIPNKVISAKTIHCLYSGFFFTKIFHFHPYNWSDNGLVVENNWKRKVFWPIHLCLFAVYYIILAQKCYESLTSPDSGRLVQLYLSFLAAFYLIFVAFQTHALLKRNELVNFMNQYFRFAAYADENYLGDITMQLPLSELCGKVLQFQSNSIRFNTCAVSVLILATTVSPTSLGIPPILPRGGLLGAITATALELSFAVSFMEISTICGSWSMCVLLGSTDLLAAISKLLQDVRPDNMEFVRVVLRFYGAMSLLSEWFSSVMTMIYGFGHLGLILLSIFCIYAGLKFSGIMAVGLGLIGINLFIILGVCVTFLGNINHFSLDVIKNLQTIPPSMTVNQPLVSVAWVRKAIASTKASKVRVGSLFYYDRILVMTTLEIVIQNIVNLFLLR